MEEQAEHSHTNYVKIWAILLGLLVLSVLGPMIEIKAITLIAAFGIGIVKAGIVAAYFMHLKIEKRIIWYILVAALLFLGVLFAGLAPDIMKSSGDNWTQSESVHPTPFD